MTRRPDIEEYKQLIRAYDSLPPRSSGLRPLGEEEDPRYEEDWKAILAHPIATRGARRGGMNSIALARRENEAEDRGLPYWGEPTFDIEVIEGGFAIDVTYPRPGIKTSSDDTDYSRDGYKRMTCWGVERLKKKQRKRWDKYARRLVKLGVYDKEVGWPDADPD